MKFFLSYDTLRCSRSRSFTVFFNVEVKMEDGVVNELYPAPTVEKPCEDTLVRWYEEGVGESTDGCIVELDGTCPHGYPSWFLHLNIIV